MITVSKISGESFDLNTGKELPKSLVLTNGRRELLVVVDDDTIREIIEMEMESRNQLPETPEARRPGVPPHRPPIAASSNIRMNPELSVPELAEMSEIQDEEPPEEEGPGAVYDDPATGVPSL